MTPLATASLPRQEARARVTNNLNQLTKTTIGGNDTALTYDANGNMTSQAPDTKLYL